MILANAIALDFYEVRSSIIHDDDAVLSIFTRRARAHSDLHNGNGIKFSNRTSVRYTFLPLRFFEGSEYICSISSVLLSRLILNLRLEHQYTAQGGLTMDSVVPSRMLFAPRLLGNLTAELRDDDEDDREEEE